MRELLELNRYLHDFTAAMWVCATILIWLIWREGEGGTLSSESGCVLQRLARKIALISIPSLVISLLSGAVRAVTFQQYEFVGEVTTPLIVVLVVKHAAFVAFIVWGIAVHLRLQKLGTTAGAV
ncbi:MAG: hypothetical protein ACYTHJ_15540 [Planctomycetota bacterium]